jgi:hypothetical protein
VPVLVVQEANGPLRGQGVWKMPTGLVHAGKQRVFVPSLPRFPLLTPYCSLQVLLLPHFHHALLQENPCCRPSPVT